MIGMPIPYRYYTITGYQKYMGQTDYQERTGSLGRMQARYRHMTGFGGIMYGKLAKWRR